MESVGQLFITGISGTALTEEEKEFIKQEDICGVNLFAYNYQSPAQLAELINSLQTLRKEFPLFICVDQEGGRVQRFKKPFTEFPAMQKIAQLDSPKISYDVHRIMAEELSACGINIDFSPCSDILFQDSNVIGDRAFGDSEKEVSKHITAAIRGLQANGIMACAKHFPGHGRTSKDSHLDLPIIKTPLKDLIKHDIQVFKKAAKARVEFLMMAHLMVDAIDDKLPTSLSPKAYALLREEARFTKVIVTDDMEMGAIIKHYGTKDAAIKALDAGADILLYRSIKATKEAYLGVQEAIKTKQLKIASIEEKISRVNQCKKQHLSSYKPVYIPVMENKINTQKTKLFCQDLDTKLSCL